MALQRLSDVFIGIPSYIYNQVTTKVPATVAWLNQMWTGSLSPGINTHIYELYIQPLDLMDALILGGSAALAVGIMLVALPILGKPFIALSVLIGFAFIAGGCAYSRHRVKNKFNAQAVLVLDGIIQKADQISHDQLQLTEIAKERNLLNHDKFKHKKKEIAKLDKHISDFQRDGTSHANFDDIKGAFIEHLKGVRQRFAS